MTRFDVARTQQPKSTAAYGSLRFGPLRYQLKRTIGMLPTPDNSEWSRHDNTVRYKGLALQIAANRHRHHFVKAKVRVHDYPDGELAIFHGPRCIGRYQSDGLPIKQEMSKQKAA
ncbi:hypothetical protein [Tateyamaria sp.]|uniref:hypothetical protein n=1 Tax=Tateyamaria sp. TaxID=1929288 RepID=UPI003B210425